MQRAQSIRRSQDRAGRGDFEGIGFILVKFLNFAAGILGADHQRRVGSGGRLRVQLHASLPAGLIEESGDAPVKAVVFPASTHGSKGLIDDKLTGSNLNLRGHGHEVE